MPNTSADNGKAEVPAYKLHKVKHYGPSIFFVDALTAGLVGVSAAIPISIIDYSIIAKVAGVVESSKTELVNGVKTMVTAPHKYFLPCKENKYATVYYAVTTVYFFTYLFSNTAKSVCESMGYKPDATNLCAGIFSGFINIALTVWKDSLILKVLPPKSEADRLLAMKPVPMVSRLLFATRDMLTCIAAFTIAPKVAEWLSSNYRPEQLPLKAADCGQILTPAGLQAVTTLIHITAIRYQRTSGALTASDLWQSIRANYVQATALRICRIVPAFGIGGIYNREKRSSLLDFVEK